MGVRRVMTKWSKATPPEPSTFCAGMGRIAQERGTRTSGSMKYDWQAFRYAIFCCAVTGILEVDQSRFLEDNTILFEDRGCVQTQN